MPGARPVHVHRDPGDPCDPRDPMGTMNVCSLYHGLVSEAIVSSSSDPRTWNAAAGDAPGLPVNR